MSDERIAAIGRLLAAALRRYARERDEAVRQHIAQLQTELCQAVKDEEAEKRERSLRQQPDAADE